MTHLVATRERRRSQRIPHSVPLFVTFADYPLTFAGKVKTLDVSRHGCTIQAPRPFPHGTKLRLDIVSGNRSTTARVIHSDPVGTGMHLTTWTVALELDTLRDIWMLESPPRDRPT
jgi:hypothetical protein